MNNSIPW